MGCHRICLLGRSRHKPTSKWSCSIVTGDMAGISFPQQICWSLAIGNTDHHTTQHRGFAKGASRTLLHTSPQISACLLDAHLVLSSGSSHWRLTYNLKRRASHEFLIVILFLTHNKRPWFVPSDLEHEQLPSTSALFARILMIGKTINCLYTILAGHLDQHSHQARRLSV